MRKLFISLLAAACCMMLPACGTDDNEKDPDGDTPGQVTDPDDPDNDNDDDQDEDTPLTGKDVLDGKKYLYEFPEHPDNFYAMEFKDGMCKISYIYSYSDTEADIYEYRCDMNWVKEEPYSITDDGLVSFNFHFRGTRVKCLRGYIKPAGAEIEYERIYHDNGEYELNYRNPEKLKATMFVEYYSDRTRNLNWEFNRVKKLPDFVEM